MKIQRINLWSGPRNVSTALMYAFAQRTDTRVLDEPLYAHYLRVSGAEHPGRDEVLATMENDGEKVVSEVMLADYDRPVLFIKNMAHHFVDLQPDFLRHFDHVFLIRDPEEMLPSLINQIPCPILRDTALARQWELYEQLTIEGQKTIIIDSRELLMNPSAILRKVCRRLGLAFEPAMHRWKAGPIPEDGIWAKHWYHNLHQSTGFEAYRRKKAVFPPQLVDLLNECKPYYAILYEQALKAGD